MGSLYIELQKQLLLVTKFDTKAITTDTKKHINKTGCWIKIYYWKENVSYTSIVIY